MSSIRSLSGKRVRNRCSDSGEDDASICKKNKTDILGDVSLLNKSRIYNIGCRKKPAELFRKDLISAMKMPDCEQLNREDYLLITDTWKEEWEKGVQVPVNSDVLPHSDLRTLRDPPTDHNFRLPKKLIKHEEDSELNVKYELDLMDLSWLNALRESEENIDIPEDILEDVIDQLEHQSAQNIKAKQVGIEYDDQVICDVCRSPDAEDGNEMVFCESCNICVHQACYGITLIPDDDWLCSPCKEYGSQKNVTCILCPNLGGALKPTSSNQWAHVACALWVPEVSIGSVTSMEPVTKIKQIPQSRWNLVCHLCNVKQGTPIQCSIKTCKISYHVTCAFTHKLKMKAIVEENSKGVKLKSYCQKHSDTNLPNNVQDGENIGSQCSQREIEIASFQPEEVHCNQFWMYVDINKINQTFLPKLQDTLKNLSLQTLQMYIDLIFQYWKLKRTSNYGIPLLKLNINVSSDEIHVQQRNDIMRLRVDLERIRNLSYMITRREKIKRNWLKVHQRTVESTLTHVTGVTLPQDTEDPVNDLKNDFKLPNVNEENIKLAKDLISCNIIYSECEIDKTKPKLLVKNLSKLVKIEKLRREKPNPYAKFYLHKRLDIEEATTPSNKSATGTNNATPPKVLPLSHIPNSASLSLRNKHSSFNGFRSGENMSHELSSLTNAQCPTKLSNDLFKKDEISSPVITTRSSSLIGYKIPKKKQDTNELNPLINNTQDVNCSRVSKIYEISTHRNSLSQQKLHSSDGYGIRKNLRKHSLNNVFHDVLNYH